MNKLREWISIQIVKAPGRMVLLGIFVANLAIIGVSGLIISSLAPPELEDSGFWSSVFHMTTMVLGVGGVENLIEDIGQANVFYVLCCIAALIVGMVVFTGAIIGYMSEFVSSFIEEADSSSRKLRVSGHTVILNWNTRAAEIVNELLYKGTREKVVILAGGDREDILLDIDERLADTLQDENSLRNRLTIVVREGDTSSAKQLGDISIKRAKSVIILSDSDLCVPGDKGNSHTIKTLIQVGQLLAEEDATEGMKVIVEVEDDWTLELVDTVVAHKKRKGSCNIVPVDVNRILGQIFAQFSIMPELNIVYSALFSNRGATFYTQAAAEPLTEEAFVSGYLGSHCKSIPLTVMEGDDGTQYCYYMSDSERHIRSAGPAPRSRALQVSLNPDFEIRDKHVLLLGHNSKSAAIMEGFEAFREEWKKDGAEVLDVTAIDDEANLAQQENYKQYPFVKKAITADIFDKDLICGVIGEFIARDGDKCIMILSDDTVPDEEIDADALTYLILVQDILYRRSVDNPGFDLSSVDLVVELLDPQNYDIANNYSTNNIVISNRYISKIIMQIGEKDALFDFYEDILTYDEPGEESMCSKELYIKKASEFFTAIPPPCTAADLIRAVYNVSPEDNKSVVLGFVRPDDEMVLFKGDQSAIRVALTGEDKMILFSEH